MLELLLADSGRNLHALEGWAQLFWAICSLCILGNSEVGPIFPLILSCGDSLSDLNVEAYSIHSVDKQNASHPRLCDCHKVLAPGAPKGVPGLLHLRKTTSSREIHSGN